MSNYTEKSTQSRILFLICLISIECLFVVWIVGHVFAGNSESESTDSQTVGWVSGHARLPNGDPMPGLRVYVERFGSIYDLPVADYTDASGYYSISVPTAGLHIVYFGNSSLDTSAEVVAGMSATADYEMPENFGMRSRVTGFVKNRSGQPVKYMELNTFPYSSYTDESGFFSLYLDTTTKFYQLMLSELPYVVSQYTLPSSPIEFSADSGELVTLPDIVVTANSTVTGRITNMLSQPINNIQVRVYQLPDNLWVGSAQTNSNGEYTVRVAAGNHKLEFVDSSGLYKSIYYGGATNLESASTVAVGLETTVTGIDVSMASHPSVKGTVRNEDGQLLNDIYVALLDSNGQFMTSAQTANGEYQLIAPNEGSYFIEFSDSSSLVYMTMYYPAAGAVANATPVLLRNSTVFQADVVMYKNMVTGRVLDSDGNPITGFMRSAQVEASTSGEFDGPFAYPTAVTDENGYYTMTLRTVGDHYIRFSSLFGAEHQPIYFDNALCIGDATLLEVDELGQDFNGINAILTATTRIDYFPCKGFLPLMLTPAITLSLSTEE